MPQSGVRHLGTVWVCEAHAHTVTFLLLLSDWSSQPACSASAIQHLSSRRESARLKHADRYVDSLLGLLHVGIRSRNVRAPPLMTHCFHDNHSGENSRPSHVIYRKWSWWLPLCRGKKKWWGSDGHTQAHTCIFLPTEIQSRVRARVVHWFGFCLI